MTPEELDAINNLNQTIQSLGANATVQNDLLKKMAQAQGVNVKNINENLDKFGKNVSGASGAAKSLQTAEEAYAKSMQNLQQSVASVVVGFKGLGTALTDSTRNFQKYNTALDSFGDAALSLGKALGPLGTAIGGAIKGITMIGTAALKQADNTTKAYDELSKVGSAGGITTKQILEMGHNAGLTSKDLGKLTSAIKANSTSIAGLGSNAADGMKIFGEMAAVGTDTIAAYSKLGVSQEELIKSQSDYVALQMMSGRSLKGELQDRQKLQKASLEYQDNLLTLSQLTGEDVEGIKKKQQEALQELNWQISQRQLENKARKLEAQNTEEGKRQAEALRKEMKTRADGLGAVASIGSKGLTEAVREMQATGTATSKGAAAMIRMGLGPAIKEYNDTIKKGGNAQEAAAKLQDEYNKRQSTVIDRVGFAAAVSKDVAESFDLTSDSVSRGTQQLDKNLLEETKAAQDRIKKQKEKSGDPALEARAALTKAEITATVALDKMLGAVNPLMNGFNATTVATTALAAAAAAAATALGVVASKKLLGQASEAGSGLLGKLMGGGAGGAGATTGSIVGGTAGKVAGGTAGKVAAGTAGKVVGGGQTGTILEKIGGSGNLLEGAAKGLRAFANPQVALGAAGFGVAIAAVGAGIAGATWLVGKALPTLSEGFGAFEKLDGDKLIASGKGIGAVGAGLAVFGAGGAAAGFGAIAATLSEGINAFFGGKTPFERVEEFSKLNIDPDKTEKNAKAYIAFGKAMASSGMGSAISGLGNLAGGFADFIGKAFGNKDAIQKFVDFTKLDVDPDKASKLAEAFKNYAEAMGSFSSSKKGSSTPSGPGAQAAALSAGAPGTATSTGGGGGTALPSGPSSASSGSSSTPSPGGAGAAPAAAGSTKVTGKTASGGTAATYEGPGASTAGAGRGTGGSVQQLLDFIGKYESRGDYNILVGGKKADLTNMTVEEVLKFQDTMRSRGHETTAVGKYQIIKSTLLGNLKRAGVNLTDKFDQATQDKLGIALLKGRGLDAYLGKKIDADTFADKLAQEWASLPTRTGKSYYAGVGSNASHIPRDEFMKNLPQARTGGMFEGPNSGYLVTLHGNETVIPNLEMPDMANVNQPVKKQELPQQLVNSVQSSTASTSTSDSIDLLAKMFGQLESKFDDLIDAVEAGNDTQSKILKYSKA